MHDNKVKVVLNTFVRRRVPVREDTYPEPSACEVGWPVPFLAAFISQVFPPDTHSLLGGSEQAFSHGIELDSNSRSSARETCALTTMQPRPTMKIYICQITTLQPEINGPTRLQLLRSYKEYSFHHSVKFVRDHLFSSMLRSGIVLITFG